MKMYWICSIKYVMVALCCKDIAVVFLNYINRAFIWYSYGIFYLYFFDFIYIYIYKFNVHIYKLKCIGILNF